MWRKSFWRISCSAILSSPLKKCYISFDSDRKYRCLHIGRTRGKFSWRYEVFDVYQGVPKIPKKSKRKRVYASAY